MTLTVMCAVNCCCFSSRAQLFLISPVSDFRFHLSFGSLVCSIAWFLQQFSLPHLRVIHTLLRNFDSLKCSGSYLLLSSITITNYFLLFCFAIYFSKELWNFALKTTFVLSPLLWQTNCSYYKRL